MPSKKCKKRAALGQAASEIADAIQQLDKIAQNAVEDKPYDQFGKYVAAELRQLPQQQAILLQQEIQNCITRSKLSCLPPTNVMSPGSYPGSTDSPTLSMNNDYDVVSQAMMNSFGAIV